MAIGIEHVNDYTLIRIRIVAADSIRDSIRTKISNSKVPRLNLHVICIIAKCYVACVCVCVCVCVSGCNPEQQMMYAGSMTSLVTEVGLTKVRVINYVFIHYTDIYRNIHTNRKK